MKNVLVLSLLAFLPFLLSAQSKQETQAALADELSGEYIGTFARNGVVQEDVTIRVTRKGENLVRISAGPEIKMKTFRAELTRADLSAMRRIKLETSKKINLKEGLMTPVNGRLSFAVSHSDGTLDVFSGVRAGITQ